MPYRLILLIGSIVLTVKYAIDPDASLIGRGIAATAMTASLFFPDSLKWYMAGVAVQLAISLFVILRSKVTELPRR